MEENIVERLYTRLDEIDTTSRVRHLVAYTPTNDEIDRLFERSRLEIGTVTTLQVIKRVISANPDTFHAFALRARHRVEDPQAEGFIAWLPLTQAGRQAMLDGTFSAADPAPEHVAGQHDIPAAIYIWGLYAPGRLAVGFAWAFQRWSTPLYRDADIYARAVTPSGRRFVHRLGFETVSAQDGPVTCDLFVFRRQPPDERPVYDSHTVMPLHRSLVEGMCKSPDLPLELATALEDIGQRYMDLADDLNREIIRRGLLDQEPDPEESGETRIEQFLDQLLARAGTIHFVGGERIDGTIALGASEPVRDAIRTAILVARPSRRPSPARDDLPGISPPETTGPSE